MRWFQTMWRPGLVAAAVACAGCGESGTSPEEATSDVASTADSADQAADEAEHDDHHHHDEGPHGGTIADWGGGTYHVEFTVDHDAKQSAVYVLDSDAKGVAAVKADDGMVLLTIQEPAFQVELQADPQEGEAAGAASRYVGTHENLGIVREFAGTISGSIEGTPYAGDFEEQPHGHEQE
jgi:hypothetical protein